MTTSTPPSVIKQLSELQVEFKHQLASYISEIRTLWEATGVNKYPESTKSELLHKLHLLASTAGIFQITTIKSIILKIENTLNLEFIEKKQRLPCSDVQQSVNTLLDELVSESKNWEPTKVNFHKTTRLINSKDGNLVYLLSSDIDIAHLSAVFENTHYQMQYFSNVKDIMAAYNRTIPALIIVNGNSKEVGDRDKLLQLKNNIEIFTPVILISDNDDIHTRILATHVGAHRFFVKPVNSRKLIQTMDSLTTGLGQEPFRVLIIDDDPLLLRYYSIILQSTGMKVKTLSKPLEVLEVMRKFKPDISVICAQLSECTGQELAQVIRQDDDWASMPIIFLSTESNLSHLLTPMNYGVDDFLVKPVEIDDLMNTVISKAKRSSWTNQQNKNLKEAIIESEYSNKVMNQHNIVSTTDTTGRIIYVNDTFCEISGYSREELIGNNHRMIKSDKHPKSFYEELWRTISTGNIWHGQVCNWNKNGEEYWVEATIVPFLNDKGKPYKYVSTRTNITQLSLSEERLKYSQNFAKIGTWDWNIPTGKLYWSDQIWPLFGYDKEKINTTYDNFISAVHPEDRDKVNDAVNNCINNGDEYNIEHRVVWPDGSVHWLHESGDVLRGEEGKPVRMLGVVQDITDRIKTEELVRESEEKYRLLFEFSEEPMWIIKGGNFVMSNKAASMVLGYDSINDLENIHPSELSPQLQSDGQVSKDKANEMISIAFNQGYHRFDWNHQKKNGDVFPVDVSLTRIPYNGESALFCVWRDISKQRLIESKLRKQRKLLDSLHHSATTFMTEMDINKTMEGMLDTLLELTDSDYGFIGEVAYDVNKKGYLKSCVLSNCTTGNNLPEADNKAENRNVEFSNLNSLFDQVMISGNLVVINNHVIDSALKNKQVTKTNSYSYYCMPIYYGIEIVAVYAIANKINDYKYELKDFLRPLDIIFASMINRFHLIKEREDNQLALIAAKEEAEQANLAKSKFLSSMSHELRTPMSVILGFCQLLKMDETDIAANHVDNINEIYKAGKHLLKLINEVLDLSKIEAGQLMLTIESISLLDVIKEAILLIKVLSNKRGIDIIMTINDIDIDTTNEQLPLVLADFTRLKQVLINLLSNAVKYNSQFGKIIINITHNENDLMRISVTDTGIGISEDEQKKLFSAFERLDAEFSDIEGTGIGLMITKNIIEQMAGSIGIDSKKGVGSTFWIEIPKDNQSFLGLAESEYEEKPDNFIDDNSIGDSTMNKIQSILYIEDNPSNMRMMDSLLGRLPNIKMITAPEPLLGIELAFEYVPDLILLDINLPGMSGFEVLKVLKNNEKTQHIPVFAISADAMPSVVEKGLKAGFDNYITKPINVKDLLNAVSSGLQSIAFNEKHV